MRTTIPVNCEHTDKSGGAYLMDLLMIHLKSCNNYRWLSVSTWWCFMFYGSLV